MPLLPRAPWRSHAGVVPDLQHAVSRFCVVYCVNSWTVCSAIKHSACRLQLAGITRPGKSRTQLQLALQLECAVICGVSLCGRSLESLRQRKKQHPPGM